MNMSDSSYRGGGAGATLAATFPDREAAKAALTELHEAGFRDVWLGVTHGDAATGAGATVSSEGTGGGVMSSIGRFFSGEGAEEQALHEALMSHGLTDDQARGIESSVPAGAAIVTVGAENDAAEAMEILRLHGGQVADSAVTSGAETLAAQTPVTDVDRSRKLQLREERLSIDKQRVSSGEARIRKDVVSEQQSIDVPVFREELFIQRRPVTGAGSVSMAPIGEGEEIRVPLSEERVDVLKRTVVTEEVAVGTRKVEGTEHVSDTLRREELRVDADVTGTEPRLRDR